MVKAGAVFSFNSEFRNSKWQGGREIERLVLLFLGVTGLFQIMSARERIEGARYLNVNMFSRLNCANLFLQSNGGDRKMCAGEKMHFL